MRGARRLGALFLFVASLVVASKHDDLTNSMINKGFTAEGGRDGNPQVFVKMLGIEQTARVRQELDAVRAARRGDAVDGSKLERGPIVLEKPDDGDEKTIDSID